MKKRIEINASSMQLLSRLLQLVDKKNPFKYLFWVKENYKNTAFKYYGMVDGEKFKIVPIVIGRNFFTPIIKGSVEDKDGNTVVECSVRNSPCINCCIVIGLIGSILNIVELIQSHDFSNLSFTLTPVILLAVFVIMSNYYKRKAIEKFEELVRSINGQ